MKKLSLKSKILLGAIMMGSTIAGAHAIVNMPSPTETLYNWTGEPNATQNPNDYLPGQTVGQAEIHFGCDGEEEVCATGQPTSGMGSPAVIRLN